MRQTLRPWLWLSVLAAGTSFSYMHRVLLPWEQFAHLRKGISTSVGDLYSPWAGTRALFLEGKNPYGPEVSRQIQIVFYGHPITQEHHDSMAGVTDEQRFAYPVYVAFLLAPTVYCSFATLQTWAPLVLLGLAAISVLLWLQTFEWRPGTDATAAIVIFILASPQIAQGLQLRQLGLLVAFLVAVSAWCTIGGQLGLAGAALAFSTIKPQMSALPVLWFLIWSAGDLENRWRLPAGFAGTLAALAGAGEIILPGWPKDFFLGLAAYRKYVSSPPLLQFFLGKQVGAAAIAVTIAGLLAWAWKKRKCVAPSREFASMMSAFLVVTVVAMPLLAPFNQALLILPVLVVLRDWSRTPKIARYALVIVLAWPWIVESVLLAFPPSANSLGQLRLLPLLSPLSVPFVLAFSLATRWGERTSDFSCEPASGVK
jgi:hypothetical protein